MPRRAWLVLANAGVLLVGCGSSPPVPPSIQFSTIPAAAEGGSEHLSVVAGRAVGARQGDRVVLFAKSPVGVWWVQPLAVQPFTDIDAEGNWNNAIHLGVEYAALLVAPGYMPSATTQVLPGPGGQVLAASTVKGTGEFVQPARRVLTFSGYDWEVRHTPSDRGGPNDYDPDNAWTDGNGHLHLKLSQREGRWRSAEVVLTRALGYGSYWFVVRDTAHLDPAATFSMFTWDNRVGAGNNRELDVEIGQWGNPRAMNGQYVVQPHTTPANVVRFAAPAGQLTHSFRWEPGKVSFRSVLGAGSSAGKPAIAEHVFTSGVPEPGEETVRMNLYFYRHAPNPPAGDVEVVIEQFRYFR